MNWDVVAGTGHRPQHMLPEQRTWIRGRITDAVRYLVVEHGTRVGISGLALGFDTWWAQAILDAGLALWAYVPCPQQADRWTAPDRRLWRHLIEKAAKVRYFADVYTPGVMYARNDGMLDDATALLAGWRSKKRSGGTWHTVNGARTRRLPGVLLDVDQRTTRLITYPERGQALPTRITTCNVSSIPDTKGCYAS